jgi:membrane associated rhomboid family serine protease
MRDAAVGFQCPGCVAEGAKATRSGRTAYGGIRPGNPGLTSLVLIVVNAAVWLLLSATGRYASDLYAKLALLPEGRCVPPESPDQYFPGIPSERVCDLQGQEWVPGVADGAWWQLLTSAFTHIELWHIGFNMLALWILAPQLELAVGRARFLALYLLSALAGSTLVYWLADPQGSTLGASGAVFGLMGALLVLAVKVRGDVRGILTWVGLNALITVLVPNISWQGHLGGFLGGLVICVALVYAPRRHRTFWQVAGMVAVGLALLGAIMARTAVLN